MQMTVLVPLETRRRKIVQLVGPNRWMEKSPRVFLVAQFSAAPKLRPFIGSWDYRTWSF